MFFKSHFVDEITKSFSKLIDRLNIAAEYHKLQAEATTEEIKVKQELLQAYQVEALRAEKIAAKLRAIFEE